MTAYIRGFINPIQDSQQVFRKALLAMSEPGIWQKTSKIEALEAINEGSVALVLSLLDADTTLWLPLEWQNSNVKENLAFHSGCKITNDQNQADFAICSLAQFLANKTPSFSLGDERYPDQSATIIIQLPENETLYESRWTGPGIPNERVCYLPIPEAFWSLRESLIPFPRGLDFIFTQGDQMIALPRTTLVLR